MVPEEGLHARPAVSGQARLYAVQSILNGEDAGEEVRIGLVEEVHEVDCEQQGLRQEP